MTEVRTGEGSTQYQWDALDRLILAEVMSRDGATGFRKNYHYDPAGRLTQVQAETWDGSDWQSGPVEHYVFAGFERLQKRASDGTVLRKYFSDGFIEGSEAYLYGRDRLGSVVELIDAETGATVSTREYSPYGEITDETGTVQADFGYTGHFYDADLALHHAPFRVYDAALGRWLSADPLPDAELLPEGTNLYAYVGNDPINYVDPLGLCKSGPSNNSKNSRATPPRQGGGNGTGNGGPPKRTASSASPSDGGGGDAANKAMGSSRPSSLTMRLTGATKSGLSRVSSAWRGSYGPSALRKHHLAPRELLKQSSFTGRMRQLGYSRGEAAKFLDRQMSYLPNVKHMDIHRAGYNRRWMDWGGATNCL